MDELKAALELLKDACNKYFDWRKNCPCVKLPLREMSALLFGRLCAKYALLDAFQSPKRMGHWRMGAATRNGRRFSMTAAPPRINAAAEIKSRLTMRQVAEMYGFEPSREGFIRCPLHGNGNERTASCKLYPEHRGFYCHACGTGGDVTRFVQLLFDIPFREAARKINDDFSLGLPLPHLSESEAARLSHAQAVQQERRRAERRSQPEESPDYGVLDREHIYPGGQVKKTFYRRRDGTKYAVWYHLDAGQWRKGRGGVPHILYQRGTPSKRVYIAEGEKDADNLFSLFGGYCALGENGAGKGKWLPEYTRLLRFVGVQCAAVFSDNDEIGREYAQETAAALSDICRVKLIDLRRIWPDMPNKADVSDYIAANPGTARENIGRLVRETPLWRAGVNGCQM